MVMLLKNTRTAKCKKCPKVFTTNQATRICPKCTNTKKKVDKEKQKERKRLKREAKRNTNSYLGPKAWAKFSLWVRKQAANFEDYVECFTCRRLFPISEMQAGHCFHRGRQQWKALDFDPRHIRPQCQGDNGPKGGLTAEFTLRLVEELGIDAVKEFERRRAQEPPLTPEELKEIIKLYGSN